jgi:hypothetical protein
VKNFAMILVCVALGVGGQLLLKKGMSADRDVVDRMSEVMPRLWKAALNPVVIAGFVLYGLSAALWLIISHARRAVLGLPAALDGLCDRRAPLARDVPGSGHGHAPRGCFGDRRRCLADLAHLIAANGDDAWVPS